MRIHLHHSHRSSKSFKHDCCALSPYGACPKNPRQPHHSAIHGSLSMAAAPGPPEGPPGLPRGCFGPSGSGAAGLLCGAAGGGPPRQRPPVRDPLGRRQLPLGLPFPATGAICCAARLPGPCSSAPGRGTGRSRPGSTAACKMDLHRREMRHLNVNRAYFTPHFFQRCSEFKIRYRAGGHPSFSCQRSTGGWNQNRGATPSSYLPSAQYQNIQPHRGLSVTPSSLLWPDNDKQVGSTA